MSPLGSDWNTPPTLELSPLLPLRPADYIREEVRRQGFSLGTEAGRLRVEWMTEAWAWAEWQSQGRRYPTFDDIVEIGRGVERDRNRDGLRRCGVRVGWRVCPEHEAVPGLLADLMARVADLEPLDFYRALLEIHPFVDGNGRAGKIALAWTSRSWQAPTFPPADFWGTPIRNP